MSEPPDGGWARAEVAAAALGGFLSLAATVLLPFHLGGGLGAWIAAGFLAAGILLGIASIGLAGRFRRDGGGRWIRNWALLGAAGFAVSGWGLVGDVIERPWVAGELAAVVAVAAWWTAVWWGVRDRRRWFARFSLLCAASAAAALVAEALWEAPAGAVPARFAYTLWGPWGLWLAAVLRRLGRDRG